MPSAELSTPVAASPPWSWSYAMTTTSMLMPPNTNPPTALSSSSPATGTRMRRQSSFGGGSAGVPSAAGPWALAFGRDGGRPQRITATARKLTALSAKATARLPEMPRMMAANAGPMTYAMLSSDAYAVFAGPRSASSLTRLGRYAPMLGPKNEERQAARIVTATMISVGPSVAAR